LILQRSGKLKKVIPCGGGRETNVGQAEDAGANDFNEAPGTGTAYFGGAHLVKGACIWYRIILAGTANDHWPGKKRVSTRETNQRRIENQGASFSPTLVETTQTAATTKRPYWCRKRSQKPRAGGRPEEVSELFGPRRKEPIVQRSREYKRRQLKSLLTLIMRRTPS